MNDRCYSLIAQKLLSLLYLFRSNFTDSELKEVEDFIDHGEYGLALETFCSIVVEENKPIGTIAIARVKELASLMSMSDDVWKKLSNRE
jgi:hypothetical protein